MKALVISESQEMLDSYAIFFTGMGYENLCYHWLLKAMDNLEEIKPDLVFIDASDYPRHWKTLVQHIRASGLCSPVILLATDHLNDEDRDKAEFLGVYCITTSIEEEDTRIKLREYLNRDTSPLKTGPESAQKTESTSKSEPEAAAEIGLLSEAELSDQSEGAAQIEAEIKIEEWTEAPEETAVLGEETISVECEEIEVEPEAASEAISLPAMNTEEAEIAPEAEAEAEPVEEAEFGLSRNEVESLTEPPESIFIDEEKAQTAEPKTEDEKAEEQPVSQDCETFTFIHPSTKTRICGRILEYRPPLLFFRLDDETLFRSLRFGQKSSGVVKRGDENVNVSVQIQGLDEGVAEVCILKK